MHTNSDSEHEAPPQKKPMPAVYPSVQQASGDERELCKNEKLIGADPGFQYNKYYFHGEDQGPNTPWESTETRQGMTENQIHKDACPFEQNILQVCDQFAGGKPACVWLSETLPWDLGLPMTTRPPPDPALLQAFILCEGRPPVLLSLYGQREGVHSVQDYTKETARLLHWSLLDYCHLDFSVLPCSMKLDDFEQEQSLEKAKELLQSNVQEVLDAVEFYMKRSLTLDGEMLCQLRAATRALTGATFLRSFLTKDKRKSVFLMGKKQRNSVSLAIEEYNKTGQYQTTYPSDKPVSDKAIVALEVAKRISFMEEAHVTCSTEQVQSCLQHIKQHTEDQVDISLQLINGQGKLKCDRKNEAYILLENPARKHRHLEKLYNKIREGHLLRFCQNYSFKSSSDLYQFQEFCSKQPNSVGFPKPGDVDVDHGLSFLYCSLWGPSPHITSWCLTHDHEKKLKFEDLITTALAFFLFPVHRDMEIRLKTGLLDKRIFPKPVCFKNEMMKFSFPSSVLSFTKDLREYFFMIKEMSPVFHPRYLDDRSLPIPATLLSVTVTEDAVSVELPSQHWYLALRLLADREVDETDRDGNTLLHIAADKGNLEAITLAVKSGASLRRENSKCMTPLHCACSKGHRDAIELVLSRGADVNIPNVFGNTPLHMACLEGLTDTVEVLLRHGANVNAHNKDDHTPLHKACTEGHKDTSELLLLHKASVNVKDKGGSTPLHKACSEGHKDNIKLLILCGANVNVQDEYCETPLHIACNGGNTDAVELLLNHKASVNVKDKGSNTPLHKACSEGNKDTVELLLRHEADVNAKDKGGNTPLHAACSRGRNDAIELLLRHRAILNVQNKAGVAPLGKAFIAGQDDSVELLLRHGADVNAAKDECGNTLLHDACRRGHKHMVELLLHHKASVKVKDTGGKTPLHAACRSGYTDIVELLLHHKAFVNVKDKVDKTPLHDACSIGHKDTVELLLRHKAFVNVKDKVGNTPLHDACSSRNKDTVELLLLHQANVNKRDERGSTPLHIACSNGHKDTVELLLHYKASVNVQDKLGNTPLLCACSKDNKDTAEVLLCHGANVNVQNKDGNTPLHGECSRRHNDTAELLVQHGADVNVQNKLGNTSLHRAFGETDGKAAAYIR